MVPSSPAEGPSDHGGVRHEDWGFLDNILDMENSRSSRAPSFDVDEHHLKMLTHHDASSSSHREQAHQEHSVSTYNPTRSITTASTYQQQGPSRHHDVDANSSASASQSQGLEGSLRAHPPAMATAVAAVSPPMLNTPLPMPTGMVEMERKKPIAEVANLSSKPAGVGVSSIVHHPKPTTSVASESASEAQQSRSERKRSRERQRRNDVNVQFAALTAKIRRIIEEEDLESDDSSAETSEEEGQSSAAAASSAASVGGFDGSVSEASTSSARKRKKPNALMSINPSNRVDLISRTIAVLDRMQVLNNKRQKKIGELRKNLSDARTELDEAKKASAVATAQGAASSPSVEKPQDKVMMMVPMMVSPSSLPGAAPTAFHAAQQSTHGAALAPQHPGALPAAFFPNMAMSPPVPIHTTPTSAPAGGSATSMPPAPPANPLQGQPNSQAHSHHGQSNPQAQSHAHANSQAPHIAASGTPTMGAQSPAAMFFSGASPAMNPFFAMNPFAAAMFGAHAFFHGKPSASELASTATAASEFTSSQQACAPMHPFTQSVVQGHAGWGLAPATGFANTGGANHSQSSTHLQTQAQMDAPAQSGGNTNSQQHQMYQPLSTAPQLQQPHQPQRAAPPTPTQQQAQQQQQQEQEPQQQQQQKSSRKGSGGNLAHCA